MAAIYLSSVPFYETGNTGDTEVREIISSVLDIKEEENHMLAMLELMGNVQGTENKEFFSYTNTFLYDTITVNDGTPPNVTTSGVTVTVDSAASVKVGDVAMASDGTYLYITAISGNDLTMKTLTGTYQTADNEVLAVPTTSAGEGSNNGDMAARSYTQRKNHVQIFDNGIEVTDLMKAGKTILEFADGSNYYAYKVQNDAFKKHRIDIANNHLVGQYGTSTDASGNTAYFSRGLDNAIQDLGGVSQSTDASGVIDKDDFAQFCRALDLARSPKEGMLPCGGDINNQIDDLFDTILASGAVDYGSWGYGSNAGKAVELGVNRFKVYGRTFDKFVLTQMDHPNITAISGFEFPDLAYYIPKGQVKGENGQMVDRIVGRYLKFDDDAYINGRFHEKLLGGLAPVPTAKSNTLQVRYTSWEGLQVNAAEQFGRLKIAA